jgi:hypothetical protein
MLKVILTQWHGSSKYASWRLVETIIHSECLGATQAHATKTLLDCLSDTSTSTYANYRLLHYLVRRRKRPNSSKVFRYLDRLSPSVKKQIKQLLPGFLAEQAFDLNIITLYAMQVLGATHAELEAAVREKSPKPVAVPIRNVLILAAEPIPSVQSFDLGEVSEDEGQEEYH